MTAKAERLAEFLKRLEVSPAAKSFDEARMLVERVLHEVEDELCPAPEDQMGPPLDDNRHSVPGHPEVTRYRNKGHNTFLRQNGAIRIEELPSKRVVLDKPGADGRRVLD